MHSDLFGNPVTTDDPSTVDAVTHNGWHLALYLIDRGDTAQALALWDERIWGVGQEYSQDQIGAVALLARRELRGVDVGARWGGVGGLSQGARQRIDARLH